jgi:hypothetical protein
MGPAKDRPDDLRANKRVYANDLPQWGRPGTRPADQHANAPSNLYLTLPQWSRPKIGRMTNT